MTQTTAEPATARRVTVASFATDRIRRLTERLAHSGYELMLLDEPEQLLVRAACGDIEVAIVHVPRNRPYLRDLVPQLVEHCGVLVVAGDAGDEGGALRIWALRVGADDVVPEDIGLNELSWRVRKVADLGTRRGLPRTIGPLELHASEARLRGVKVSLTRMEMRLLHALARAPDVVQRREELLTAVWNWPDADSARSRTLDNHASRLRRRLARDGDRFVVTVRGVGYRLR